MAGMAGMVLVGVESVGLVGVVVLSIMSSSIIWSWL